MSSAVKRRRGTTAQHATFTGQLAELTVDTDKKTVVVHDGVKAGGYPLRRHNGGVFDAAEFGVKADGVTDDTVALQAALTFSMTSGGFIQLPAGVIKITAALDYGESVAVAYGIGPKVRGAGKEATWIKQFTNNVPILKWGGSFGVLTDVGLAYNTEQTSGNTGAIGIEFLLAQWFTISRVNINVSYTAMKVRDTGAGTNYIFNCTFEDMVVNTFKGSAMHFQGYNGGCGGICVRNIWALNRDPNTLLPAVCGVPFVFGATGDTVIQNINIQDLKAPGFLYVFTTQGMVFNGIHVENCELTGDYNGALYFHSTMAVVSALLFYNNKFLVGNGAHHILIRLTNDSSVTILSGREKLSTVTSTAYFYLLQDATERLYVENFAAETAAFQNLDAGDYDQVPTLIRYNANHRRIDFGNTPKKWVQGITAPTTGTWAVGDIVWNRTPNSKAVAGWICATAGTPGTWHVMTKHTAPRASVFYSAAGGAVTPERDVGDYYDIGGQTGSFTVNNPTGPSPDYGDILTIGVRSGTSTGQAITLGSAYSLSGAALTTRNDGTMFIVSFMYLPTGKWKEIYRAG